jgi:hypothetical protein
LFRFGLFASFCLFTVRFRFRLFLKQTIFPFIFVSLRFFRSISFISHSFSLQIFAVSLRCESSEIMPFFRFQVKQNFRFNFNFRFQSENESAPYSQVGKLLTNILFAVTFLRVLRVYPFVLATACAVYASKVLPYAAHTLAIF